ncbi:sugar ABC transporter ATP-binding protein [Pseudoalteromonas phenolica]|uniref:Sugar ABC transporter ATP-binding protein n=1 Tax=Pseudoalteromonas phenolica TaxID=161398 RepID=A0A4Q7IPY0_9GAMM|nr:ATP-binding cassette domain-containing protein [Pseudoalteromonas phenolica]RZQ53815.1 sugar ABC transporter ATP-binding protein [Pseudoalteromonas phenolica]
MIEINQVSKDMQIASRSTSIIKNLFSPKKEQKRVVDSVSFNIQANEKISLLGHNGCGKSTMMKMLAGIIKPTEGEISVNGLDPFKHRKKLYEFTGVLFAQKSFLYSDLSVKDCLDLYSGIHRQSKSHFHKRLKVLDDYLEIGRFQDQPVRTLSFGQRMRGEIASALIHDPSVVLLDEPTVGLDLDTRNKFNALLKDSGILNDKTVVIVTHDLPVVKDFSDRTIVMHQGCVQQELYQEELERLTTQVSYQIKTESKINPSLLESVNGHPNILYVNCQDEQQLDLKFKSNTQEQTIQSLISQVCSKSGVSFCERKESLDFSSIYLAPQLESA